MSSKKRKKSKRFTSYRSAVNFAKKVGGDLYDLRNNLYSKSKYKVRYDKQLTDSYGDPINNWNESNEDGTFAYNNASKEF